MAEKSRASILYCLIVIFINIAFLSYLPKLIVKFWLCMYGMTMLQNVMTKSLGISPDSPAEVISDVFNEYDRLDSAIPSYANNVNDASVKIKYEIELRSCYALV